MLPAETEQTVGIADEPLHALELVTELSRRHPWIRRGCFVNVTVSSYLDVDWYVNTREQVATLIREIGGRWGKNDPSTSDWHATHATWTSAADGVRHKIIVDRGEVCTRVEVGRHTETVEVPTGTRTEEREVIDYEWRCHPVLETEP